MSWTYCLYAEGESGANVWLFAADHEQVRSFCKWLKQIRISGLAWVPLLRTCLCFAVYSLCWGATLSVIIRCALLEISCVTLDMLVYIHSRISSLLLLRYFIELKTFVFNIIAQAVCTEPAAIAKQRNASETVHMLNQIFFDNYRWCQVPKGPHLCGPFLLWACHHVTQSWCCWGRVAILWRTDH